MNLAKEHLKIYDALASEYEARVPTLTKVTQDSVKWFSESLKEDAIVLDIGCGVGNTTQELLKYNFEVTAIDLSPRMIEYAEIRNPEARCIAANFLTQDFDKYFDGILEFAFLHLFPIEEAVKVLRKIRLNLKPDGLLYAGTTKSTTPKEGFETKDDYSGLHKRYRKHWTEKEFTDFLIDGGFSILDKREHEDPFGKKWMEFLAKKIPTTLPLN